MDDPTTPLAYALSSLLLAASTAMVIGLESLFMKNLPRDVRGAMTVLLTFFLGLGALLFNVIGGPIFDNFGPSSPFLLVSAMDMALCALALYLGCSGYLTYGNKESSSIIVEKVSDKKIGEESSSDSISKKTK